MHSSTMRTADFSGSRGVTLSGCGGGALCLVGLYRRVTVQGISIQGVSVWDKAIFSEMSVILSTGGLWPEGRLPTPYG